MKEVKLRVTVSTTHQKDLLHSNNPVIATMKRGNTVEEYEAVEDKDGWLFKKKGAEFAGLNGWHPNITALIIDALNSNDENMNIQVFIK